MPNYLAQKNKLFCGLALALLTVAGCGSKEPKAETAPITTSEVRETLAISGIVTSQKNATLIAEIDGTVKSVPGVEGQEYKTGDPLLLLDSSTQKLQLDRAAATLAQARVNAESLKPEPGNAQYDTLIATLNQQLSTGQADMQRYQAELLKQQNGYRPEEIAATHSQVEASKASYNLAKTNWKRSQELFEEGAISQSALDEARATYLSKESQLREAEARYSLQSNGYEDTSKQAAAANLNRSQASVRSARQNFEAGLTTLKSSHAEAQARVLQAKSDWELAQENFDKMTIKAPFSGVLANIDPDIGDYLKPSTQVGHFYAADNNNIQIEADVAERNLRGLKAGLPVEFEIRSYPQTVFQGSIERIQPYVDADTGNALIVVQIEHQENSPLWPGQTADLSIVIQPKQKRLTVPFDAVAYEADRTIVLIPENDTYVKQPVVLGAQIGNQYLVVSGVEEGQTVVVNPQEILPQLP